MTIEKRSQQEDTNNNYQISKNCATAHIRFHSVPYIPAFLQLPRVRDTKLHYQKVPKSAIWIPTRPVFASLSASIAHNLRLLPFLLHLRVLCAPCPSMTEMKYINEHWNRQSQYVKISSIAGNITSEQPAEQTLTNLQYIRVLHLGWSSLCFTAPVGLIDSQMLQTVLCFFLLPGRNFKLEVANIGTFTCTGWDCSNQTTPIPPVAVCNVQLGVFPGSWFCHCNGSAIKP